ncbi:glycosyltransferase family 4 protein [Glaciimonas sp. Gout2]|uniref:glycosyltransferase family 4 protein n=1 Tax=unclassified Glaciimonas TaxID=2644401 RepID=UPI002B226B88|nr:MULTISPECIES: glycosyltransferase family 4 protein [unclassified Glaciimonas]MEB0010055.1 glycosyltransferase family 4 protein [Glaciimonas sp. Cout2]MEB0081830.1 glycosyltransferase family 4 protein [Glaciimonas sp. Gout2]
MKINFLLPTPGHHPVGGYKVVYEYANGLVARGHDVTVTHQMIMVPDATALRQWARYAKSRLKGDWLPTDWFKVDPRVKMRMVLSMTPSSLGKADALIATAWETAEIAVKLPVSCGKKFYFIQHFEEWSGDRDRVLATWRLPLQKIVIADWLRQIAIGEGHTAHYIPNGVDFVAFGTDIPAASRDPHTVIMLYHNFDWKGSVDGLTALRTAKVSVPDLKVILFGVPQEPAGLEPWFEYHQLPSQDLLRSLYNRAAIFLSPSWAEGWPLPPAEAMLCSAATVLTDIGGHREYGVNGETTRFGRARTPDSLVPPLLHLLNDSNARIEQSKKAQRYIAEFTWDVAVSRFDAALHN